jgi:hypothetical protein
MARARTLGPAAVALAALSCADALLTAPPGSSLTVFANPDFIPATGGMSVISAVVTEPAGTLVPDGTVVQFFTNLGHIDPTGKTHNGVAQVNLLSDGRSGTAKVVAASGGSAVAASPGTGSGAGATNSVNVTIGPVPATVFLSAIPNRLTDSRTTHLFAQVYDAAGNPIPNVQVIFSITGTSIGPIAEHLDSGGTPVFTDNNGTAEDILRTQYPFGAAVKTVTVQASTTNGKTATVVVTIN